MKIFKGFRNSTDSSSSVRMKTRFGAKGSLITNESSSAHQAESGKSRFDFVPLKGQNMANAKTLHKRIALVAAAAVGVGMLVATPAFAVSSLPTLSGAAVATVAVGSNATTSTAMGFTAGALSDTATLTAAITSRPLSSSATASGVTFGTATLGANAASFVTSTGVLTATAAIITAATVPVNFTPDVPGTFLITLTNTAGTTTTQTFTITATSSTATFIGGGNATPVQTSPVAVSSSTITNGASLTAITGGFATFALVTGNALNTYNVSVSGGTLGAVVQSGVSTTLVSTTTGYTWTPAAAAETLTVRVNNSGASTSTLTVQPVVISTGLPGTALTGTVTWYAAGSTAVSKANSTAYIASGVTPPTSSTDGTAVLAVKTAQTAAGNAAANILVAPKDGNGNTMASETLTVTVAGPGSVALGTAQSLAGPSTGLRAVTGGAAAYYVNVFGDGTTGVSTITISDGSTVLATKTVTFYDTTVATLTATVIKSNIAAAAVTGFAPATNYMSVVAKDAAGNAIPLLSNLTATSSSTATATVTAPAWNSTDSVYYVAITGVAAGPVTITVKDSSGTISATGTFAVTTAVASTVTLTLDKATYAPGSVATVTLTAKNAAGNAVSDGTYTGFLTGALTSSAAITSTLLGANVTFTNGVATATFYAPLVGGPLVVSGTTGTAATLITAAQSLAFSANATVTSAAADPNIAAAKAAADAATAAVATLSTTVATLVASITAQLKALSVLVKKIMLKLKIK